MATPVVRLRRTLQYYAFAAACLAILLVAFLLLFPSKDLKVRDALSALGLNLIASVLFALIFSLINTRVQERVVLDSIDERFQDVLNKVAEHIASYNAEYLPRAYYPASNQLGKEFNEAIMTSLRSSDRFIFRGTSAKYVAARVRSHHGRLQDLKVVTLDPGSPQVLRRRAIDRQRYPHLQGMDVEEIVARTKDEILMAVVALFDCRRICTVEIAYVADTSVKRIEMLEDCVYISSLQSTSSENAEFPETRCFSARSFAYTTEELDAKRLMEIAEKKVTFSRYASDEDLLAHLRSLTGRQVTEEEVEGWRTQYATFAADFTAKLQRLSR